VTHEIETAVTYKVEDHASETAHKIAQAFHHAGEASKETREKIGDTFKEGGHHALLMGAGILGIGLGFEGLREKVAESNREFVNAKRGVEGILFSMLDWPKGASAMNKVTSSQQYSAEIMERLQATSYKFATGLTDVADAYKLVTISTGRYRMSQEQLQDLTTKAIAAHRIFGVSGAEAADAIGKTLLTKTVRATGEFGKYLRMNLGDIHKLNNQQILAKLNKALSDLPAAGAKMAVGMDASIFRIQHTVEELIRGVSGPAFSNLAGIFDSWADKLKNLGEDGKTEIEHWGEELSHVVDAMKEVASTVQDIVVPAFSGIQTVVKATAEGWGALVQKLKGQSFADQAKAHVAAASNKMTASDQVLGKVFERATYLRDLQEERKGILEKNAYKTPEEQKRWAYVGSETPMAKEEFAKQAAAVPDIRGELAAYERLLKDNEMMLDDVTQKWALQNIKTVRDMLHETSEERPGAGGLKTRGGAQVNIYGGLHVTQDFKDQDPDRVWVRMKDDIEGQAERRVTSQLKDPFVE
jgi:hypothetical protein